MKKRWIQDPKTGDLIPAEEYHAHKAREAGFYVMGDIQPYQAVAVDVATGNAPVITSRSAHREYLKRNGYVELGNDAKPIQRTDVRGDFNVRAELTRATHEILSRRR